MMNDGKDTRQKGRATKKGNIPIRLEPTTFQTEIECYNHYTNQSFPTRHHGSICHIGAGQPTWPIVWTPNWLNHHSTAICPDGQQADLAFRPKFCPDRIRKRPKFRSYLMHYIADRRQCSTNQQPVVLRSTTVQESIRRRLQHKGT